VWHLLEPVSRKSVETAEKFADGLASVEELAAAWQATWKERREDGLSDDPLANARLWATDAASQASCDLAGRASAVASGAAWATCWASGLPAETGFDQERAVQCRLLRCIFGNPFRQRLTVDAAWLEWNDGLVRKLAGSILASRQFEDVPVLADAVEEAGATDPEILAHLRGPGPHVRGCFAVDLLLGRS
jgi:hypothetical protein